MALDAGFLGGFDVLDGGWQCKLGAIEMCYEGRELCELVVCQFRSSGRIHRVVCRRSGRRVSDARHGWVVGRLVTLDGENRRVWFLCAVCSS